jgi:hypothetical protein
MYTFITLGLTFFIMFIGNMQKGKTRIYRDIRTNWEKHSKLLEHDLENQLHIDNYALQFNREICQKTSGEKAVHLVLASSWVDDSKWFHNLKHKGNHHRVEVKTKSFWGQENPD